MLDISSILKFFEICTGIIIWIFNCFGGLTGECFTFFLMFFDGFVTYDTVNDGISLKHL